MSMGIRINNKKRAILFMKQLDKAKIPHHIWNVDDFIQQNYNGPIDIELDDEIYHDRFYNIAKRFTNWLKSFYFD